MPESSKKSVMGEMPGLHRNTGGGRQRFIPVEKPKNAKGTALRLLKMLLGWKKSLLIAAGLTLLSVAFDLATPYLIGQAVNAFDIATGTISGSLFRTVLVALAACYFGSFVINTVTRLMVIQITQQLIHHIRASFFQRLQKIPLGFFDTRPHGDTMSRMTNDVDNLSNTAADTTTQFLSSVFLIIGSLVMMLVLSPWLTLVTLVTVPLIVTLTKVIARHSRSYFLGQQRKLGQLNGIIEENIVGYKMVKAFNRQDTVLEQFKTVNRELRQYSVWAQIWAGFLMPFMNVIGNLSFALIASVGGVLSVQGAISVGVVISFVNYSKQFTQPLNNIAGMLNTMQSALAGAERVFEILDEAEERPDRPGAQELGEVKGHVEFRHVSFSYDSKTPVLKDVSFSVEPGQVVALVGQTGAGKTTIVNLLTRFYELTQGQILIDGKDITDVTRKSLHRSFSVVLQDTCLFTDTMANNIRYSRPGATDEQVKNAAVTARADGFITRMKKGYDTMASGSADSLSQGQRQLVSIARAVLCDAPILILDEATSSVDTRTEKEIQKALLALLKGHTSFLIAHRLSTIRDADRIIVIGDGRIVETGTHHELMEIKGVYYEMATSQMGLDA